MWRLMWTLSLLYWSCEAAVTCKDENNGDVDWYILYKQPGGVNYMYVDQSGKRMGTKQINDPNGILAHTLQPIFQNMASDLGFISYNDQPSRTFSSEDLLHLDAKGSEDVGHSKGVVIVEKGRTGIWLLHSTPKFPLQRTHNSFWPSTGNMYGQTFICVTFQYEEFQKIGLHLQYIGANAFDKNIPNNFHTELQDAANGVKKPPDTDLVKLTSNRGTAFHSIAKPMGGLAKNGDLYVTISERVKSSLYVQTWGGQPQRAKSYCSGTYKVENVDQIVMGTDNWPATSDHSKWSVATDQNHPWTCIADVNRAKTQFKRRGGALCVLDADVTKIFTDLIDYFEGCNNLMYMMHNMAQQGLDFIKLLAQLFV